MKVAKLFILLCCAVFVAHAQETEWRAQHVVLIGIDGLSARSVEKGGMPFLHQLMKEGSYTLKKTAVLPSSSAVNWATIFMGAGPEQHGFTTCCSTSPELEPVEKSHYGLFPSIWGLLRDQYPESLIAYFYQWGGFQYFAELEAMDVQEYVIAEKDSPIGSDEMVVLKSCDYIKQHKPNLIGIFVDEPDHHGHVYGFDSPQYYKKIKQLDKYVKNIVKAVKKAGIYDETIFIITSDHGGIEKDHGGDTPEERDTPLVICGKGIKKGHEIEPPVMQYDVAPTIADILKIATPDVWIGKSIKEIFE